MARPISGEWAIAVARHGVDPRELEERWDVSERFYDSYDALVEAADRLYEAVANGLEGCDMRESVAVAGAEFEQALAEFRDRAREAQRYAGGCLMAD